jgi:hypothetical protein
VVPVPLSLGLCLPQTCSSEGKKIQRFRRSPFPVGVKLVDGVLVLEAGFLHWRHKPDLDDAQLCWKGKSMGHDGVSTG